MRTVWKTRVREILKRFDIGVARYSVLEKLEQDSRASHVIGLLQEGSRQHIDELLQVARRSRSQNGQDMFVLLETGFKQGGYFVEFGATNGIDLSNTYLLEREFGWQGILSEPARIWHSALRSNRTCHIETDCVWSKSNVDLNFGEADWSEFSGIRTESSGRARKVYTVRSISLLDLLNKHNAPNDIDYLSIDTEGSEYEILSNFDFEKYRFHTITCEHNFSPLRERILSLLSSYGYARVFEHISGCDDWYVGRHS